MQSLPELQRSLAAALISRDAQPLSDCIIGACELDAESALAVYRNNIFGNYRNALRDDYPAVLALVGAGFFHGACDAYAREHASQSGDLNDFGAAFAAFSRHGHRRARSPIYPMLRAWSGPSIWHSTPQMHRRCSSTASQRCRPSRSRSCAFSCIRAPF
jgi:hypothetical protein